MVKIQKIRQTRPGFVVLFIFLSGLSFRLLGLNWDQGYHLHPDERFLSMVAQAIKFPKNLVSYFDPNISTLNPTNVNFSYFVYSHLPLIFVKTLAVIFRFDGYDKLYLLGRTLSAVLDSSIIIALYLLVKLITKPGLKTKKRTALSLSEKLPLYTAFLYSLLVFPIQQAHFFTTDSFVNTFFVWSVYFSFKYFFSDKKKQLVYLLLTALFTAFSLASKISLLFVLPVIIFPLGFKDIKNKKIAIKNWLIYGFFSYFFLRLFDPYLFQNAWLFNPLPNSIFVENIKELQKISQLTTFYPPGLQWVNKNFWFGLKNLGLYGVGPIYFLLILFGIWNLALVLKSEINKRKKQTFFQQPFQLLVIIISFYFLLFFVCQSLQVVKTMRYYLFLYPFLAIIAAYGLFSIKKRFLKIGLFFLGSLWTIAFLHIYLVPHSRTSASIWINQNLSNNSRLIFEYWDDPLPLSIPESFKNYSTSALDFYEVDTPKKWRLIAKKLAFTDYLSLSSNRLWGTIPFLPELYPITSRYYRLLFAEKLGFKKIAEFTSYPTLEINKWKLEIPDQGAEEAFTVYDHPKVVIFQKDKNYSPEKFYSLLYPKK